MAIRVIRAEWLGIPTGPGVNTFFSTDDDGMPAMLQAFYTGLVGMLPSGISIQVAGEGSVIDEATGNQTGTWTETQPALVTATGGPNRAAGVGAVVTWKTQTVGLTRLIRGRSFICPLDVSAYADDGTLADGDRATLQSSASSLIQDANLLMRIWSRPPPDGAGIAAPVTDRLVNDRVAYLGSRRR